MHSETNERTRRIQSSVLAGKASISGLKAKFAGNMDEYVNQQLQKALHWFDDVEVMLGILKDERTLADESMVLDHAEFFLDRIAIPQLKAIQDMAAQFGPNIQSVG